MITNTAKDRFRFFRCSLSIGYDGITCNDKGETAPVQVICFTPWLL